MIYIKFKLPISPVSEKKETAIKSLLKKVIIGIVSLIIPKANPSFDKYIPNVTEWLIEYDNENDYANREIGFDNTGKIIMIMPWKREYGYLTDNNLKLSDFYSTFKATNIDKEEFERYWMEFEALNN